MGYPSVYPTGVTVYDRERTWSGYTIFQAAGVGALLIDMNGREVQLWKVSASEVVPSGHF
jgi:hypothetical protein